MLTRNADYKQQLIRLSGYMSIELYGQATVAKVDFNSPVTHIPYRALPGLPHTFEGHSKGFSGDVVGYENVILRASIFATVKMRVPIIDVPGDLPVVAKDFLVEANVTHVLAPDALQFGKLVFKLSRLFMWIPVFYNREILEEDMRDTVHSVSLNSSCETRELTATEVLQTENLTLNPGASDSATLTMLEGHCGLELSFVWPMDSGSNNSAAKNSAYHDDFRANAMAHNQYPDPLRENFRERTSQRTTRNPRSAGKPEDNFNVEDTEDPAVTVKKGTMNTLWRVFTGEIKPVAQRNVAFFVLLVVVMAFVFRECYPTCPAKDSA